MKHLLKLLHLLRESGDTVSSSSSNFVFEHFSLEALCYLAMNKLAYQHSVIILIIKPCLSLLYLSLRSSPQEHLFFIHD